MSNEFSVLGKGVPRKDAIEKVKGEARYIPDIQLPKMLHAKFLRSPHAHARIKNIDTSKAEALPGVKCVFTHQNVPKVHPMRKFEYLLDETELSYDIKESIARGRNSRSRCTNCGDSGRGGKAYRGGIRSAARSYRFRRSYKTGCPFGPSRIRQ